MSQSPGSNYGHTVENSYSYFDSNRQIRPKWYKRTIYLWSQVNNYSWTVKRLSLVPIVREFFFYHLWIFIQRFIRWWLLVVMNIHVSRRSVYSLKLNHTKQWQIQGAKRGAPYGRKCCRFHAFFGQILLSGNSVADPRFGHGGSRNFFQNFANVVESG